MTTYDRRQSSGRTLGPLIMKTSIVAPYDPHAVQMWNEVKRLYKNRRAEFSDVLDALTEGLITWTGHRFMLTTRGIQEATDLINEQDYYPTWVEIAGNEDLVPLLDRGDPDNPESNYRDKTGL